MVRGVNIAQYKIIIDTILKIVLQVHQFYLFAFHLLSSDNLRSGESRKEIRDVMRILAVNKSRTSNKLNASQIDWLCRKRPDREEINGKSLCPTHSLSASLTLLYFPRNILLRIIFKNKNFDSVVVTLLKHFSSKVDKVHSVASLWQRCSWLCLWTPYCHIVI